MTRLLEIFRSSFVEVLQVMISCHKRDSASNSSETAFNMCATQSRSNEYKTRDGLCSPIDPGIVMTNAWPWLLCLPLSACNPVLWLLVTLATIFLMSIFKFSYPVADGSPQTQQTNEHLSDGKRARLSGRSIRSLTEG